MDYPAVRPEWESFEKIQPPTISWRRASRAVATTTDLDPFATIGGWQARSRWLFGCGNNQRRVERLRSTQPHGFNHDGDPWYAAVLYPAPPDPIYGFYNLVGVVAWVGHLGCLWPGEETRMLPLVEALARRSRYFVVPVFFGQNDNPLYHPYVLLP